MPLVEMSHTLLARTSIVPRPQANSIAKQVFKQSVLLLLELYKENKLQTWAPRRPCPDTHTYISAKEIDVAGNLPKKVKYTRVSRLNSRNQKNLPAKEGEERSQLHQHALAKLPIMLNCRQLCVSRQGGATQTELGARAQ